VLLLFEEKEKGGCLGAAKVGYKYMAGQGQVNPCESSGTYLQHHEMELPVPWKYLLSLIPTCCRALPGVHGGACAGCR
jgi:hypothetical protein